MRQIDVRLRPGRRIGDLTQYPAFRVTSDESSLRDFAAVSTTILGRRGALFSGDRAHTSDDDGHRESD